MPKFKVDITRTSYAHTTIEVEAKDLFDARELALNTAGNYSYNEKDADYEVGTATEIKEVEPVTHKFLMYMHVENDMGDIIVSLLRLSTLDEKEAFNTAASLYELSPNMVCVEVLDTRGNVVFQEKVEHYVPS
jgi:hypothetical protein